MAAKDDYLIDLLVDMGSLTNEQLAPIREEAASTGEGLVDILLARKIIRPIDVAQAKAGYFGYEFVSFSDLRLADDDTPTVLQEGSELRTCITGVVDDLLQDGAVDGVPVRIVHQNGDCVENLTL